MTATEQHKTEHRRRDFEGFVRHVVNGLLEDDRYDDARDEIDRLEWFRKMWHEAVEQTHVNVAVPEADQSI